VATATFAMDTGEPTAEIPTVVASRPDIFTSLADATDDVTDVAGVQVAPRAAAGSVPGSRKLSSTTWMKPRAALDSALSLR
jgi:hypothetical protein